MSQSDAIRRRSLSKSTGQTSPPPPVRVLIFDFEREPRNTAAELRRIMLSWLAVSFQIACLQGDGCQLLELMRNVAEELTEGLPSLIFIVSDETSLPGAVLALVNALHNVVWSGDIQPPCVVVTASCGTPEILELRRQGAADVWLTPLRPAQALARILHLVAELPAQQQQATTSLKSELGLSQFVGESPALWQAIRQIPDIARSGGNVLIRGATGTGKEICARAIHNLSPRSKNPFVAVNCGAFPPELVENELFGHVAGAFTGANKPAAGLIAQAEGGTLFLDEIDSSPFSVQSKLLRFLQDKRYRPLSSQKVCLADVRVLTASNADLEAAIQAGTFRKDLYYRLAVTQIVLPPLVERAGDLLLLADHFLKSLACDAGTPRKGLSSAAKQRLLLHSWPGNVRELENVIASAVLLSKHPLIEAAEIIIPSLTKLRADATFKILKAEAIDVWEKVYLQQMLLLHGGNITSAAKAAGKHRSAFWQLLRTHRLLPGISRARN